MLRTLGEPSSPVHKVWKPELYKIQLEAPTPKPLQCLSLPQQSDDEESVAVLQSYGSEFHGEMGHLEAEQLLNNTPDGTYLIRKSPNAHNYYTLSVRFNNRTKHYKVCFKSGEGHYLQDHKKRFESINDLVADGLVTFYMQLHAGPIIQQINEQTKSCYQQSPYMTLNRRKLRALSNELRKSLGTKNLEDEFQLKTEIDSSKKSILFKDKSKTVGNCNKVSDHLNNSKDSDTDLILPAVYEKAHRFKVHNFKGLNWCEFCANFLWGFTAQGVKCEACGFVAHNKCSELVPPKCVPDLKRIRGVFGTDLTTMVQLHNCCIPFVVRRCVEEVEARGMLQEGIYRVSGFADEIDALKLALDRDGEKTDMSEAAYGNVNVIAGTLKLYLRLLPVPLITFQAYPHFMEASRENDSVEQIRKMKIAVKELPQAHFDCLKFMIEHLKRVASHYAVNKMNEHNLATVFAPTLIATPQHLINLTEEIFMLSYLISSYESIFETK